MEYTHFVSVAALVFNEAGEVLLIKSPNRGWEYPGGMVEPGESIETALHREIKEESGVDIVVKSFAGICKNVQRDVVNIDFICEYAGGNIVTSDESLEVKWVSKEEAVNMVTFPLTKKRMEGMLEQSGKMYCFAFRREPFEVVEDNWFELHENPAGRSSLCTVNAIEDISWIYENGEFQFSRWNQYMDLILPGHKEIFINDMEKTIQNGEFIVNDINNCA